MMRYKKYKILKIWKPHLYNYSQYKLIPNPNIIFIITPKILESVFFEITENFNIFKTGFFFLSTQILIYLM